MVSSTWTAVAGSLTAGDSARRPMSASSRNANSGSWWKVRSWPGHQPGEYRRVGHLAAVQVGDRGALLKRVADAGPEHDHGAVGGTQQPAQVELLQDRLAVRPQ